MYINLASIQVTISSIDTHTTHIVLHRDTQTHTDIRFGYTKLGAKAFGGGVGPFAARPVPHSRECKRVLSKFLSCVGWLKRRRPTRNADPPVPPSPSSFRPTDFSLMFIRK